MNQLIESRISELADLCRRHHVARLDLFGSAATGAVGHPSGDLDFFVEFDPLEPAEHADAYFGLLFALEDLFCMPIDLIETGAVRNPYFLHSANQSRTLLYAA
jgi:uncharacterized protein